MAEADVDGNHLVAKSPREKINRGGERRERYDNKSRGRVGYFDDISSSPFRHALRAESDVTSHRIIATSSSSVDRRQRKRRGGKGEGGGDTLEERSPDVSCVIPIFRR